MTKRTKTPKMAPLGGESQKSRPLEEDEERWKKRLVSSKKFQAQYSSGWEENRRLIFSEMSTQKESSGAGTPPWASSGANAVAYGWGLYEGLETSIYVQNPEVIASARDASGSPIARRVTQICKYDFDQMNVKDVGNLCLLDTFIAGYGAVIESVETYQDKDDEGKNTGDVEDQDFEIRRIDPKDILFDRSARRLDLSDCKYLFVAWYPTVEQLKNDPNITDLPDDVDDWPECTEYTRSRGTSDRSGSENHSPGQTGSGGEKDPAFKQVCVWETYDKVNHELLYISDHKHYIIGKHLDGQGEPDWPVDLRFGPRDMFPVTLLYSHPVPGRFYPRPEAELIAPQLREINITERLISEDSRTKFRKWITFSGIFSDDQKSKITDTTVANAMIYADGTKLSEILGGTGQGIDPASVDLKRLIVPIEDIAPKQDLYTRYQMLEQEIHHIVGYGPADRGGLPSTRSAREAMMINQRQDQRLDKRKSRVADFHRLMAMKHIRFLQKYMSVDRYAKIFPKAGQLADWVKYGRADISGDFEFDVVTGSSTPKTTEVKKASEDQFAATVLPILQAMGADLRPLIYRLAEFHEWDGVDDVFSGMKQKAQEVTAGLVQFNKGQMPPEALLNLVSQLLMVVLSPAEFGMIKKQLEGGGPAGPAQMAGAPNIPQPRGDSAPMRTAQGVP